MHLRARESGCTGRGPTLWTHPSQAIAQPGAHPLTVRSTGHPAQAHRQFFGYDHRFEAYVPKEKRVFGYFVLPVLVGDQIVAALDLKTDRENRKLLVQRWIWLGKGTARGGAQALQAPHRGRTRSL